MHYRNLKFYLSLGTPLEKHRIIGFKKEPFLKLYIECNAELQREAEK